MMLMMMMSSFLPLLSFFAFAKLVGLWVGLLHWKFVRMNIFFSFVVVVAVVCLFVCLFALSRNLAVFNPLSASSPVIHQLLAPAVFLTLASDVQSLSLNARNFLIYELILSQCFAEKDKLIHRAVCKVQLSLPPKIKSLQS